ncbi:MAG TPA: hypothetical protein VMQ93_06970 [Novosphingobium sp.]|nr:hypothetical protein [Novosphingobium sp.]
MARTLDKFTDDRARARRLREFLHDCAGSGPSEETDRVREAVLELAGTGIAGGDRGARRGFDVAAIHAMLDCGATMSAVLEIMGRDVRFMLSRGAQDSCLASVVMNDGSDEALAEGPTLALALLAAHVSSVLSRIEKGAQAGEIHAAPASIRLH